MQPPKPGPAEAARKQQCVQCGTCCRKGGPTLHHQDTDLLKKGTVNYQQLITIRTGETAYNPLSDKAAPIRQELVKISGTGGDWTCLFLNQAENSCSIYDHRPLECRLLACWDPTELLAVINKGTIVRTDIINPADPIAGIIAMHERQCSVDQVNTLVNKIRQQAAGQAEHLAEINALVARDLAIRADAAKRFGLSVGAEMFVLGRPLFQILAGPRFSIQEDQDGLHLYLN